jgi:hypothetical protein
MSRVVAFVDVDKGKLQDDIDTAYHGTPARSFEKTLDPANGLAPGDPARMATVIIDSVDQMPAPLRMVLGSLALSATIQAVEGRLANFRSQEDLAASTDFPAGE